jgi:O-succinylbenzoic acid--CoA ligase
MNFGELQDKVSKLSGFLFSLGIQQGDRIALILNPSDLYVMLVHALTRLRAVIVPLNVRQSASELLWQIKDCRPSLLVYDPSFADLRKSVDEKNEQTKEQILIRWKSSDELRENLDHGKKVEGGSMDISLLHTLMYTSGSTGTPKGVEITGSNLQWNALSFGLQYGSAPSDRWLLALPLFHIGGYAVLFRSVLLGSGIVLHPKFEAADLSRSLDQDGITLLSLVPTMLEALLKVRPKSMQFPGSLRALFLGGSFAPPSLIGEILERKLPVVLTYGMTESCSQVAGCRVHGPSTQQYYRAMYGTEIKIQNGQRGKAGEILLRGPTISQGYRGKKRKAPLGWFHTRDIGYIDSQKGLAVLGRKEDMIISGGENIYPVEIESRLLEHAAVEDAIVIGEEDPKWGQRVEAIVKFKEGVTRPSARELSEFLRRKLGSYKIPKVYHFLTSSSLPKTQSGKTRREREILLDLVEKEAVTRPATDDGTPDY